MKIFNFVLIAGFCAQIINEILRWRKYCEKVVATKEWIEGGIATGLITASAIFFPLFLLSIILHFVLKKIREER